MASYNEFVFWLVETKKTKEKPKKRTIKNKGFFAGNVYGIYYSQPSCGHFEHFTISDGQLSTEAHTKYTVVQ